MLINFPIGHFLHFRIIFFNSNSHNLRLWAPINNNSLSFLSVIRNLFLIVRIINLRFEAINKWCGFIIKVTVLLLISILWVVRCSIIILIVWCEIISKIICWSFRLFLLTLWDINIICIRTPWNYFRWNVYIP